MTLELFWQVLTGDGCFEGEDDAPISAFAGLLERCLKQKLLLGSLNLFLSIPPDPLARAQGLVGLPPGIAGFSGSGKLSYRWMPLTGGTLGRHDCLGSHTDWNGLIGPPAASTSFR